MKIAVCGDIIDTEHIYKIDSISSDENLKKYFGFTIYCFNNTKLRIRRSIYDIFMTKDESWSNKYLRMEKEQHNNPNFYNELSKKCEIELETIRNIIIAYWSNNQSNIPKIDFIND